MGRPREKNVSDWALWKRNQRAMPGGKVGKDSRGRQRVIDHKDGNKNNNSSSNLQLLTVSQHASKTNKQRARRSAIKDRIN